MHNIEGRLFVESSVPVECVDNGNPDFRDLSSPPVSVLAIFMPCERDNRTRVVFDSSRWLLASR